MPSRKSNKPLVHIPAVAIELQLDERLLDFAFSDHGQGDPERLLIELEEAGDLIITITELDNGDKQIQFFISED
jgi:hypothetical protein